MMNYVAVALGSIIYLLLHLNEVFNQPGFSWKGFVKANIISTIVNFIIGMSFVFAKSDLTSLYPITFFSSFILGISGQSVLKKVSNMFDKDTSTTIGLNK